MGRLRFIIPFVSILLACLFVLWPLMRPGFYVSDDGEWMVIRLSAFYQSLADGQFPVRFLGRLNNSYGYPVANFLYPGFLYIGSVLHVLGLSFVTSVKVIMAGSLVGATIWLYVSLRRKFEAFAATLGTLTFIGSPYLLYDFYKRGSVGEILAFLPASAGIYSIVANKRWLFALAVGGLIVSHNTLAIIFLGAFFVMIVVQRRRDFLWPLVVGLGLSAFFWIPAIAEKRYVLFDLVTVSDPRIYMLRGANLWMIGVAGVLAGVSLVFGKGKRLESMTSVAVILYGVSVILVLPISDIVWSIRPIATLVQFPYRMLAVGSLMAPWMVAEAAERRTKHAVATTIILLLILAVPAWYQLQNISFVLRDAGYYTTNEGTTTVADEYLPRWVQLKRSDHAPDRLVFQNGKGDIVYEYINTQRVVAHVDAAEKSLLRFHTIYYPGWGVLVDDRPVPVTYQNPHGFMEVAVPSGRHKVEAEFRETVSRFTADMVSLVSLFAWIVFSIRETKAYRHLSSRP